MAKGCFRTVGNNFFKVGHTHNIVDQRWSEVNPTLKTGGTLEDPRAFRECIQEKVTPKAA